MEVDNHFHKAAETLADDVTDSPKQTTIQSLFSKQCNYLCSEVRSYIDCNHAQQPTAQNVRDRSVIIIGVSNVVAHDNGIILQSGIPFVGRTVLSGVHRKRCRVAIHDYTVTATAAMAAGFEPNMPITISTFLPIGLPQFWCNNDVGSVVSRVGWIREGGRQSLS